LSISQSSNVDLVTRTLSEGVEQMTATPASSSITCETVVKVPLKDAFQVFTAQMGRWWPPEFHIGAAALKDVIVEPRVNGRWFERGIDGSERDWGRVLQWQPDALVALSWQLTSHWQFDPDESKASEIVVRFKPDAPNATRVELEHRYFERHGPDANAVRAAVSGDQGWAGILRRFSAVVAEAA
jgi:hypothetical protein